MSEGAVRAGTPLFSKKGNDGEHYTGNDHGVGDDREVSLEPTGLLVGWIKFTRFPDMKPVLSAEGDGSPAAHGEAPHKYSHHNQ